MFGPLARPRAAAALVPILIAVFAALPAGGRLSGQEALSVKITSPLGRTGGTGAVRIVAQLRAAVERPFPTVRFFVDGKLYKVDDDGPPYAVDWVDAYPLTDCEIAVDVTDASGHTARDTVTLKPYMIDDSVTVMSMLMAVAVYTKNGRLVSGLTAADFRLTENGEPQKVDVANLESVPANFALLIDSSQSMSARVDFLRLAAKRLAPYLHPLDKVIIAPFSKGLGTITGPTADQPTMLDAISAIGTTGGTAILDSLMQLSERIKGLEGRRVVILLTDGYDENSTTTLEQAIKTMQSDQITVYVVGIGGVAGVSLKGQQLLRQLAAETGGKAYFPWREDELKNAYDFLATDAQNRYLLAYTPSDQTSDGTWRAVKVETTRPDDLVIQAKPGYYAAKPPPIRPELEFTLADASDNYLAVGADDLMVIEDGVEQAVDTFQEAVAPVSIVLALDASGSMRSSAEAAAAAAREFVKALRPKDALSVLLFADKAVFAHELSTNRTLSLDAIDKYVASGGTALNDALVRSLGRLKDVAGRRVVVVVTDGRDENNAGNGPGSTFTFTEALEELKASGAVVFAVGLGANVDRAPLEQIAAQSGGRAYFPSDVTTLAGDYARIVENLRRRFVLSYSSTNAARDGAWRKVEIRLRSSNALLPSAGGYFAPKK
jgi:Ca-activated chloride channel family protein